MDASPMTNPPEIVLYGSALCPYCHMAKRLLSKQELAYTEISVDFHPARRDEMEARSGRETVPQIFIGATHVGGFDDLSALVARGELPALLRRESGSPADPAV
ncbi:glutaredoxin 3 [Halothiobacillus sp. DCM-1]|uniref:glutaredoxin 3 n=1 Tax=Halothiobacillus sp. DCM-1 TaxID=3112558 RepID=UPI003245B54C